MLKSIFVASLLFSVSALRRTQNINAVHITSDAASVDVNPPSLVDDLNISHDALKISDDISVDFGRLAQWMTQVCEGATLTADPLPNLGVTLTRIHAAAEVNSAKIMNNADVVLAEFVKGVQDMTSALVAAKKWINKIKEPEHIAKGFAKGLPAADQWLTWLRGSWNKLDLMNNKYIKEHVETFKPSITTVQYLAGDFWAFAAKERPTTALKIMNTLLLAQAQLPVVEGPPPLMDALAQSEGLLNFVQINTEFGTDEQKRAWENATRGGKQQSPYISESSYALAGLLQSLVDLKEYGLDADCYETVHSLLMDELDAVNLPAMQ